MGCQHNTHMQPSTLQGEHVSHPPAVWQPLQQVVLPDSPTLGNVSGDA